MTRKIHKLSAKAVAALKKPGRHSDGANLFLHISEHGGHCRKSWVFRYVRGSKTTELGLGPIANVSLAQLREKASELRRQLADGRDILADRRAAKRAPDGRRTFGQVATALMEAKRPEWRSATHASQWRQSLEAYAAPLWDRPIDEIER